VLTRMPPGFRAASRDVLAFIDDRFPDPLLVLSAEQHRDFLRRLTEDRIGGGAVYDALIATIARAAGATLLTLDTRARQTYAHVGAQIEWLG